MTVCVERFKTFEQAVAQPTRWEVSVLDCLAAFVAPAETTARGNAFHAQSQSMIFLFEPDQECCAPAIRVLGSEDAAKFDVRVVEVIEQCALQLFRRLRERDVLHECLHGVVGRFRDDGGRWILKGLFLTCY